MRYCIKKEAVGAHCHHAWALGAFRRDLLQILGARGQYQRRISVPPLIRLFSSYSKGPRCTTEGTDSYGNKPDEDETAERKRARKQAWNPTWQTGKPILAPEPKNWQVKFAIGSACNTRNLLRLYEEITRSHSLMNDYLLASFLTKLARTLVPDNFEEGDGTCEKRPMQPGASGSQGASLEQGLDGPPEVLDASAKAMLELTDNAVALKNVKLLSLAPISGVLWSWAKIGWRASDDALGCVIESLHVCLTGELWGGLPVNQSMAKTIWALSKLEVPTGPIWPLVIAKVQQYVHLMSSRELANVIWAVAHARQNYPGLLSQVASHLLTRVPATSLNLQDLRNLTWAFAELEYQDGQLLRYLGGPVLARPQDMPPLNIAALLWSLAKSRHMLMEGWEQLCHSALLKLPDFSAASLCRVAWAVGILKYSNAFFYDRLANACWIRRDQFDLQGVCMVLWAFARSRKWLGPQYDTLVDAVSVQIPTASPSAVALLLWGMAWQKKLEGQTVNSRDVNRKAHEHSLEGEIRAHQRGGERTRTNLPATQPTSTAQTNDTTQSNLTSSASVDWPEEVLTWEKGLAVSGDSDVRPQGQGGRCSVSDAASIGNHATASKEVIDAEQGQEPLSMSVSQKLQARASELLDLCRPQQLMMISWALATLKPPGPSVLRQMDLAARSVIDRFLPQEMAVIAWSFAEMSEAAPDLFDAISAQILSGRRKLKRRSASRAHLSQPDVAVVSYGEGSGLKSLELGKLLWAFAKMEHVDEELTYFLAEDIYGLIDDFSGASTAMCMWALASLVFDDDDLLVVLGQQARRKLSELTGYDISRIIWAAGTAGYRDMALMEDLLPRALEMGIQGKLTASDVGDTCWGLGALKINNKRWFDAASRWVCSLDWQFSPCELTQVVWSLARCRVYDDAVVQHAVQDSRKRLSSYDASDLALMAYSLTALGHLDHETHHAVCTEVMGSISSLSPPELSLLLWSQAALFGTSDEVLLRLGSQVQQWGLGAFTGDELLFLGQACFWLDLKCSCPEADTSNKLQLGGTGGSTFVPVRPSSGNNQGGQQGGHTSSEARLPVEPLHVDGAMVLGKAMSRYCSRYWSRYLRQQHKSRFALGVLRCLQQLEGSEGKYGPDKVRIVLGAPELQTTGERQQSKAAASHANKVTNWNGGWLEMAKGVAAGVLCFLLEVQHTPIWVVLIREDLEAASMEGRLMGAAFINDRLMSYLSAGPRVYVGEATWYRLSSPADRLGHLTKLIDDALVQE